MEETLNALLDAEADRLCNAQRYERSEARRDTRARHSFLFTMSNSAVFFVPAVRNNLLSDASAIPPTPNS